VEWQGLIDSIVVGEPAALRSLYELTNPLVFTLMVRMAAAVDVAEWLTVDAYHDIWLSAAGVNAQQEPSMVGWVMKRARIVAIRRLNAKQRLKLLQAREPRVELPNAPDIAALPAEWANDIIKPPTTLWSRVAESVFGGDETALSLPLEDTPVLDWETVSPGLSVKILSYDGQRNRVSMLVCLAAGTEYPSHRHDGVEELYLLHGELHIDGRTLHAGDFIHAEAGTMDHRVWSEKGCTCLLMTSLKDMIL
jgi:anti-sigma factor ChrR (cupin superfamily)